MKHCVYCGKRIESGEVCDGWYCQRLRIRIETRRYCGACGTHLKTPDGCSFCDDPGGLIIPGPYCPNENCPSKKQSVESHEEVGVT